MPTQRSKQPAIGEPAGAGPVSKIQISDDHHGAGHAARDLLGNDRAPPRCSFMTSAGINRTTSQMPSGKMINSSSLPQDRNEIGNKVDRR